jgi:hypothetical protein
LRGLGGKSTFGQLRRSQGFINVKKAQFGSLPQKRLPQAGHWLPRAAHVRKLALHLMRTVIQEAVLSNS